MNVLRQSLLLITLFLSILAPAAAQTTGTLLGRVTDEDGAVLPGVLVEVRSPALQGVRSAVTDETGIYRLSLLPPGEYEATVTLQGFAPVSRTLTVGLGKDTTFNAVLRPSVAEEITVTSDVPVIDTTSTTLGTNLDTRAIESLPTGRNYSSVVQITPGVSSDANPENTSQSTITVYGLTGAENVYYIEFGRSTGGIINVITKSGGNDFHGDVFGYLDF